MSNNRKVSRRAPSANNLRIPIETPMGTPVQQMWEVLRVHEERIKQLSSVVEKVLVRLDRYTSVEDKKVEDNLEFIKKDLKTMKKQMSTIESEQTELKESVKNITNDKDPL